MEDAASSPESVAPKDDYLGIVSWTENGDEVAIETHSHSDECVPESELEIIEQTDDYLADVDESPKVEAVNALNHDEIKSRSIETSTLVPSTPVGPVEIATAPTVGCGEK